MPTFNPHKIEDLNILLFPTLSNSEVRPCEVDDCNLLNTEGFGLFLTSSSSLSVISSTECTVQGTAYLYVALRSKLDEVVNNQDLPLELPRQLLALVSSFVSH